MDRCLPIHQNGKNSGLSSSLLSKGPADRDMQERGQKAASDIVRMLPMFFENEERVLKVLGSEHVEIFLGYMQNIPARLLPTDEEWRLRIESRPLSEDMKIPQVRFFDLLCDMCWQVQNRLSAERRGDEEALGVYRIEFDHETRLPQIPRACHCRMAMPDMHLQPLSDCNFWRWHVSIEERRFSKYLDCVWKCCAKDKENLRSWAVEMLLMQGFSVFGGSLRGGVCIDYTRSSGVWVDLEEFPAACVQFACCAAGEAGARRRFALEARYRVSRNGRIVKVEFRRVGFAEDGMNECCVCSACSA
jgi:hypothetical protein